MLWKAPRTNQSALLAGLYIVSLRVSLLYPRTVFSLTRTCRLSFITAHIFRILGFFPPIWLAIPNAPLLMPFALDSPRLEAFVVHLRSKARRQI